MKSLTFQIHLIPVNQHVSAEGGTMFLISENHILLLSWFIVNQMYSNVTNNVSIYG